MPPRPDPPHRLLRSVVAALVASICGAGAHLLGGGVVYPVGLFGSALLLTAVAWLLADRERDWLALAAGQLVGQQLVHGGLGVLAGASTFPLLPHDVMLYLHLAAALLAAGWLRGGERRAWAAVRRLITPFLVPALPCPRPPAAARPVGVDTTTERGAAVVLRHLLVRRGPPVAG